MDFGIESVELLTRGWKVVFRCGCVARYLFNGWYYNEPWVCAKHALFSWCFADYYA